MHLKKIHLFISILSMVCTTEIFAKFSLTPYFPEGTQGVKSRGKYRQPSLSSKERQRNNLTQYNAIPAFGKNKAINQRSKPLMVPKRGQSRGKRAYPTESINPFFPNNSKGAQSRKNHGTIYLPQKETQQGNLRKNPSIPFLGNSKKVNQHPKPAPAPKGVPAKKKGPIAKKIESALAPLTKGIRKINKAIAKPLARPAPIKRNTPIAKQKTVIPAPLRKSSVPQREVAYVTNNGVIVKRTRSGVQVYNTGIPLRGDTIHYRKGRIINGTLLRSDVDLNMQQSPEEFIKQVQKIGIINRVINNPS